MEIARRTEKRGEESRLLQGGGGTFVRRGKQIADRGTEGAKGDRRCMSSGEGRGGRNGVKILCITGHKNSFKRERLRHRGCRIILAEGGEESEPHRRGGVGGGL